jgi:hypothetical protein
MASVALGGLSLGTIVSLLVLFDLHLVTWMSGLVCLLVTTLKAFRVGNDGDWYLVGGLFYIPVFIEAYAAGQMNHAVSNAFYAILSLIAFYTRTYPTHDEKPHVQ